jgi:hypothetical protein
MAMTCAELRDIAPELALDVVDGRQRAAALEHLETCHRCRAEVASLTQAAEELLLLAPPVEPSVGFTDRVLAQLDIPAPSTRTTTRRSWPRRALALAAAAAAVVVLAFATIVAVDDNESFADTAEMRTGTGEVVGTASIEEGDPPVLVVRVPEWSDLVERYGESPDATYRLVVELDDGSRVVESFDGPAEAAADSAWQLPVGSDPDAVVAASIVDEQGRAWCTARFAT